MRLFAAVLPPPDVLDHLERALGTVRASVGPDVGRTGRQGLVRWTEPVDRHVTIAFFGEVPDGYLDEVAGALDEVAGRHVPFDAVLRGAGLFDGRTLWIGCGGDGWGPLMADAGRVGEELLGRRGDRRSRPHLTVARVQRSGWTGSRGSHRRGDARPAAAPGAEPAALAHALALYGGPRWSVSDVVLVRSRLGVGPGGSPLHDVVGRFPLRAVAG